MSAALMWFLAGSGLVVLGAFFLWRWLVVAAVVPVAAVVLVAAMCGETEMAVGLLWGTVAVNLAFCGVINLWFNARPTRSVGLMALLWLAFGLGACMVAGRQEGLGMFGGWGLVIVGLVAFWQRLRQPTVESPNHENPTADGGVDNGLARSGWRWLVWALCLTVVLVGAWLMVKRHGVVSAVLGIPESVCGAVVMAPVLGVVSWAGLRQKRQWQVARLLHGWTWANVCLATVVLGLAAVMAGGLSLTQSTVAVTLPWVAGMAVVSAAVWYLPKKTARWWGGLVVVMYFGYLISLFW